MICMYKLIHPKTGKYYVGSTSRLNARLQAHYWNLNKGTHHCLDLQKDYDILREKLDLEIIPCNTLEDARKLEQSLLDDNYSELYNISKYAKCGDLISYHPNRDQIVEKISRSVQLRISSMSEKERREKFGNYGEANGMYGKTHTPEVRKLLSEINKGNSYSKGRKLSDDQKRLLSRLASQRIGEKNPFYGRTHTEATKKILSEKRKGNIPTNARKVEVDGIEYPSVSSAARNLGVSKGTIIHRIKSPNPKFITYHYADY